MQGLWMAISGFLEGLGRLTNFGGWLTKTFKALGQAVNTLNTAFGNHPDPTAQLARAFSTVMPMRFPRTPGAAPLQPATDGLGWVARLLGRFAAIGWQPAAVLDTPLDTLFLLTAALQAHEGADCAGEDYRERLLMEGIAKKHGEPKDEKEEADSVKDHGGNLA